MRKYNASGSAQQGWRASNLPWLLHSRRLARLREALEPAPRSESDITLMLPRMGERLLCKRRAQLKRPRLQVHYCLFTVRTHDVQTTRTSRAAHTTAHDYLRSQACTHSPRIQKQGS